MRRFFILSLLILAVTAAFVFPAVAQETNTAGCIHVYDATGQYLGILVERGKMQDEAVVFIPGIGKFTTIKQTTGEIEATNLTFDSEGCVGVPYFAGGVDFIRKCGGKYYLGGSMARNIPRVSTQLTSGECLQWSPVYDKLTEMFEASEIAESYIPFTLPVALPLHYEYQ
ncbi:hypothetical protein [Desulfoferrobacter suflitae]|uniref:hypothetical protein n=1 Tax=Desulfoferrobacter suflitae TaxID=2865782 RepID=UPI0021646B67|nr:hypothetical protein [Desulfoferrobacter suflitae]MCK8603211.1 hypothetical protein [Desulfoferrobacter suflitae]